MDTANTNSFDYGRLCCFYESEYDCLVATGLRNGLELEQVKDTIHHLFLHFAEKRLNLEAIHNPKAYILLCFKRRLIDQHRLTTRRHRQQAAMRGDACEPSIDAIIEAGDTATELAQRLKAAYQKLPARCRRVIFLKYYEGLSNEEIAARTGLALRSVYNNLSEGIKLLRTEIAGHKHEAKVAAICILLFLLLDMGF